MKRKIIIAVIALLLALVPQGAYGQTTENSRDTRRSNDVDALLNSWTQGENPGAAVIVIHQGRIVHKKGYGLADVVARTPITPDTAFDLASVSKQFTAMAVMILAERGKCSYDDPLSNFFPEFPACRDADEVFHRGK